MRITQGCFSFLPDLTDDQILTQVQYCLDNGWAVNLEFTDDPHPRNTYWEMWGLPMFDLAGRQGRADGARRLPQDLRRPLHPPLGLRFVARLGIGAHLLHRQPAEERGRLPPRADGRARAGRSTMRSAPTRPTGRKESDTHERGSRGRDAAASRDQSRRGIRAVGRRPGPASSSTTSWSASRRSNSASARSRRCCWSTACGRNSVSPRRRRPCT